MTNANDIKGKKVFVTGATGFIGSRLCEKLIEEGAEVNVLVRNYGNAYRLARMPIQFFQGDLLDKEKVKIASSGCELFFHCAYGNSGNDKQKQLVDVEGTENVLTAALETNAKRVVFLSTMQVYTTKMSGALTESDAQGDLSAYGRNKLEAESRVRQYHEKYSLNYTVLQPTAVYGPFSPAYGLRIVNELMNYRVPLIDDGSGICNLLYIDDLVDAMINAATSPGAANKTFLVSGDESLSYKELYGRFENMLNLKSTVQVDTGKLINSYRNKQKLKRFLPTLKRSFTLNTNELINLAQFSFPKLVIALLKKLTPKTVLEKVKWKLFASSSFNSNPQKAAKPLLVCTPETIHFLKAKSKVDARKAKESFGFVPQYTVEKGFEEVEKWYRWYYNKS